MANGITTVGKIQQTTKYDMFKFVDGNRSINTKNAHYKSLIESIKREGQITPAIVNANMQILDGQHRFCICRDLGEPFKFIVVDGVSIDSIADINEGARWSLLNWINWYATNGGKNSNSYKYMIAFMAEFNGVVTPTTVCRIFCATGENTLRVIREGKAKVSAERYNKISKCFRELFALGFADWLKENRRTQHIYWAVMAYCWRHPDIDCKRLIRLLWANARKIPAGSMEDYMLAIETVYNKGLKADKKVYLSADYDQRKYWEW